MRSMLATPTRQQRLSLAPRPKRPQYLHPQYKVVLHNDSHNKMKYVKQVLVETFEDMAAHEAEDKMRAAHHTGSVVLRVLAQEQAEDKCGRLRRASLRSTMEPV